MWKEQNRICGNCVTEPCLSIEITRSDVVDESCEYCERVGPTLSLEKLARRCDEVIAKFFRNTSETDAVIHFDRTPAGEPLINVVSEWLTEEDSRPADDLAEVLQDQWFDGSTHRYGEDPWFIRSRSSAMTMSAAWMEMERSLRIEARIANPTVTATLEDVFGPLLDDRTFDGGSLLLEVGPGNKHDTFFRARVFHTAEAMQTALQHPERELGPRAPGQGSAGRMNARGISVFYGATEPQTALREVRPPVGSYAVVAAFRVIRPLRLLDFTKLSAARAGPNFSLFDPTDAAIIERNDFLATLEGKLMVPVMPDTADDGYLITQAVADFLSTHPKLSLDGIYYRSVQSPDGGKDESPHNVILFQKASRVKHATPTEHIETHAYLWEYEEEERWFHPAIISVVEAPKPGTGSNWQDPMERPLSLELLRDSLVVHAVKGIDVVSDAQAVEHQIDSRSAAAAQ